MGDIDEDKIKRLDGTLLLVLRELLLRRRTTLVAKRLGLSQSGVSHALSRLRKLFDDELFVRRPYGLEPTPHALDLAPRVDALLSSMGDALGLSSTFDPAESTRAYRIGAPDHVTVRLAPTLLKRFAEHAPQARVAFGQRLGRDAMSALSRGDIDLAIGRFGSGAREFETEHLLDEPFCLVSRRGHPGIEAPVTRAQFATLNRVDLSVDGDFRSRTLAGEPVQSDATMAVPRFGVALALVAQSDTVTFAPRGLAESFMERFNLAIHDVDFPVEPMRVLALRRPHDDAGASWLLAQVKAALAPNP